MIYLAEFVVVNLWISGVISALGEEAHMGSSAWRYIFYSVLALSVVILVIRLQAWLLIKTRLQLKEKEAALQLLENQRDILEIKNRNITESLNYAQRIQEALLPTEDLIKNSFSSAFILNRPRDIVSGDFYWLGGTGERRYIVVADCTGHGVPGALISMIGHDLLDKIINTESDEHPGTILDRMNKALSETFRRGKESGTIIRDGMDIGICVVDMKKKKIEFAGAFIPMFLIRENRLLEVKGDKYVLGMLPPGASYSKNEFDLMDNDIIYLFSDGYVDQFGGEDNKKFMMRRFRYLLMTIHTFPLPDQKVILDENIKTWSGTNPQVDDILVIGIKP